MASYEDIRKEKEKKLEAYRRKLGLIAFLNEKPATKRAVHEQRQLDELLGEIRENYEEFFTLCTENEFGAIIFDIEDGAEGTNKGVNAEWFQHLRRTLEDPLMKPPKFPNPMDGLSLERLVIQVYHAQVVISAQLEEIEPVFSKWQQFEKRTQQLWKAICGFDKEWQAESLYQHMLPQHVSTYMKSMSEYVSAYKIRFDMLDRTQAVLSRLITLYQGTPIEPTTRRSEVRQPEQVQEHRDKPTGFGGKRFGGR